jgi:hypothetical protein
MRKSPGGECGLAAAALAGDADTGLGHGEIPYNAYQLLGA